MECKICKKNSKLIFNKKLMNKYIVDYYQCTNCELIQTEEPYWLEEAYKDPISDNDTGLLSRNINLSRMVTLLILFYFNKKGKYLDFAGGYGIFTRLMCDNGFNFLWQDLYSKNLFAKGFEWDIKNKEYAEMITTFESFEHFIDPSKELKDMLSITDNILFSTELIPKDNLEDWWYFGFEHGQHINFYSEKTLKFLANKYNLHYYTDKKNIHIYTRKKMAININLLITLDKLDFTSIMKKITLNKK